MTLRILITMITFLVLFNGITDFYFYKRVIIRFTQKTIFKTLHFATSLIFGVLNIWVFFRFVNPDTDPTSTFYVWFMWVYLVFYLPKFAFMLVSWPELFFRKTVGFSIAGMVLGLTAAGILIWGCAVDRFAFVTNQVAISSCKLPQTFDGYRIVQFSDTHLGNFGKSDKIVRELVERINSLKPDLIVFTGDLVNTKANEIDYFRSLLLQLKAKDGIYSIMGNHDYGDYITWHSKTDYNLNLHNIDAKQREMGWKMLRNESVFLKKGKDSLMLIGVDNWGEPPFHRYGNLEKAFTGNKNNTFKILLSHNPEHWRLEVLPKFDIDLTLAGHTHAGQMVFKLFGKRYCPISLKYRYWGGLYEKQHKRLYVNEGIGYVLYPVRFGCGPEITLFTLKKAE